MAVKQTVTVTSDLSGEENASVFAFGLDGVQFEIDLTENEKNDLRNVFANYTANARKVTGKTAGGARKAATGTSSSPKRDDLDAVRAWAKTQDNLTVAERGRVSKQVLDAYDAAHKG